MERTQQVRCVRFRPLEFEQLIEAECGAAVESTQLKYLASYLRHPNMAAQTIVVEDPYVDRHYLEEFSRYYASSFRAPSPHAKRLHVFAAAFTDDELRSWMITAASAPAEHASLEQRLQLAYRGFIVVRPLPAAPIGRTVLVAYADSPARNFETLQEHRVHLLGLELRVRAVPFQQQEEAVGACATTATWSALAAVSRATGRRGPTPYEVTEAATRHLLNDRQIPAQSGLDLQQLLAAIRACGFAPHVTRASENFEAFTHSLKCYLASGIPVVLLVHEPSGYHAVTAVGFRSPDAHADAPMIVYREGPVSIATTGLVRVYVHEDRLGPYARMSWEAPNENEDAPRLRHLRFADSSYEYAEDELTVYAAIAPLYPKLRLTPRGLLSIAAETLPLMRMLVGEELREHLRVELRFLLSGSYLRELFALGVDAPSRVADFAATTPLPRYVGLVRYFVNDEAIGDVVCDTTDLHRSYPRYSSILALFPFVSAYEEPFRIFTEKRLR